MTDEVVGWPLGDVHLWGDGCTNGRWGAPWDRQGGRRQVVTGNAVVPCDLGWMGERVRGRES